MIIIFEGPDGVGKTTLFKALAKARNYKDVYVDRMFVSDLVYASKFNRPLNRRFYEDFAKFVHNCYPIFVFVKADVANIIETYMNRGENIPESIDIELDLKRFDLAYKTLPSEKKMYIDRTGKTVEQCVEEIIKSLQIYGE